MKRSIDLSGASSTLTNYQQEPLITTMHGLGMKAARMRVTGKQAVGGFEGIFAPF